MYLSPRRTLIALRARRTGALRRGDEVVWSGPRAARVTVLTGGGSIAATGVAGDAIAGSLCMLTFPSADNRRAAWTCSVGGAALPSLGTKLSVRSPFGCAPVGFCAKSLRRSGEMALVLHFTPRRTRPSCMAGLA